MDLMNELLSCLNNINYDTFDENYLNDLLDSRDSAPFDMEWCRVNEEIKALKNNQNYTDEWLNKLIAAYKNKKIPAGEL